MKELQQLNGELHKAEGNNEKYVSLLKHRDSIESQIEELKLNIIRLNNKQTKLEEWKKTYPLYQQESIIKKELSKFDDVVFPDKGLEQLDQLQQLHSQIERKIHTLE